MSPPALEARLRRASELRAGELGRRPPVDMSPGAVSRRLREVSALHHLCRELMRIGRSAGLHDEP
jgi:hypothetical protein